MRFWADENFNGDMLRGILGLYPDLDIIRVQDTEYSGTDDPTLLEAAAQQGVILITHDVQTLTKHAYDRIKAGLPMPGVIEVVNDTPIKQAVDDLTFMLNVGVPTDFENQVRYVPLR